MRYGLLRSARRCGLGRQSERDSQSCRGRDERGGQAWTSSAQGASVLDSEKSLSGKVLVVLRKVTVPENRPIRGDRQLSARRREGPRFGEDRARLSSPTGTPVSSEGDSLQSGGCRCSTCRSAPSRPTLPISRSRTTWRRSGPTRWPRRARHDLALTRTPYDNKLALIDTDDLSYAGFGGTPVKAWLHRPAGATGPLPTVVQYHGYSGGRGFPHATTTWAQAGYAHLVMDTRGQGWSDGGGPSGTADWAPGGRPEPHPRLHDGRHHRPAAATTTAGSTPTPSGCSTPPSPCRRSTRPRSSSPAAARAAASPSPPRRWPHCPASTWSAPPPTCRSCATSAVRSSSPTAAVRGDHPVPGRLARPRRAGVRHAVLLRRRRPRPAGDARRRCSRWP